MMDVGGLRDAVDGRTGSDCQADDVRPRFTLQIRGAPFYAAALFYADRSDRPSDVH